MQSAARPNPEEHRELKRLLGRYTASAHHNQEVMARCQDRELLLLTADGLAELLHRLTGSMRLSFDLQEVRLLLLDPFGVLSELLGNLQLTFDMFEGLSLVGDVSEIPARVRAACEPTLDVWSRQQHGWVLPQVAGSVALLPLRRAEGLVGFLYLASQDSERFTPDHATDFLDRFSTICAVCLENAVNRERLRLTGLTDPLTGLFNRRHLDRRLAEEAARALRHDQPLACLFVDADHFKRINDHYGHAAGDHALIQLGRYLRSHLRISDIATRYGGEEFVILLPATSLASAKHLAERICAGVRDNPVSIGVDGKLRLTVSIGVSSLPADFTGEAQDAAARLLQAADTAVYAAKLQGRDRVVENPVL